jgi:ABC-2 type transport system permease protein
MSRGYRAALAAELIKARRSRMPLMTLIATSAAGLIAGLFMFILADPPRAQRLGLLAEKAQLSGVAANWAGLLRFLSQIVAVGDLMLFAFIATWIFGREFADGTMRYLLALPVSRPAIACAKFTVTMLWSATVTGWLMGFVLILGWALGLPGASSQVLLHGLAGTAISAALLLLVSTPVALVACASRGYLAPLAATTGIVVLGQIAAALGWGAIFPWSIPAIAAGLAPDTRLTAASIAIAVLTGAAGISGPVMWWRSSRAGL